MFYDVTSRVARHPVQYADALHTLGGAVACSLTSRNYFAKVNVDLSLETFHRIRRNAEQSFNAMMSDAAAGTHLHVLRL